MSNIIIDNTIIIIKSTLNFNPECSSKYLCRYFPILLLEKGVGFEVLKTLNL